MFLTERLAMCAIVSALVPTQHVSANTQMRVAVPKAPPRYVIDNGESVLHNSKPRPNAIVLTFAKNPDGSVRKPGGIEELAEILWTSFPQEYKSGLASYFGFARKNDRTIRQPGSLRLADVEWFLFDFFDLGNQGTKLGREFRCVSSGERSLAVVLALVAQQEVMSNESYRARDGVPRGMNIRYPFLLADRLAFVCREPSQLQLNR